LVLIIFPIVSHAVRFPFILPRKIFTNRVSPPPPSPHLPASQDMYCAYIAAITYFQNRHRVRQLAPSVANSSLVEQFASFDLISMAPTPTVARTLQEEAQPVLDPLSSRMTFPTIYFSKLLPPYFPTLLKLAHARLVC
jgi:hypothetical protein